MGAVTNHYSRHVSTPPCIPCRAAGTACRCAGVYPGRPLGLSLCCAAVPLLKAVGGVESPGVFTGVEKIGVVKNVSTSRDGCDNG